MNELTIILQSDSSDCLYQQIYEYIKSEIKTGKLREDEKLPSTRSLAEYLQVSRSTVNLAYEQLLSEGYIESKPQKGYFVCRLENLIQLKAVTGKTTIEENGSSRKIPNQIYQYDFSPNAANMREFPFATWKKITRNILVDANSEMFALGSPQGDPELRETISRYLFSARGVNCSPKQIIIGAGNDYLLMLLEKILGRHVRIAMENPSYKRAYRIFDSFAYEISAVSMDESGMRVDELEQSGADVAYVMPSHQYPTGVVMPIGRRMELLKWAINQPGRYLIEDDYDSEFRYRGKPIPAFQSSDKYGKVIYIGTFSKSIAPAIRVSYMILPQPLLEIYREKCYFYSSTVSRIDQRILNEFIKEGYFERYLNKMRKIYKEKHDLMLEQLEPFRNKFIISGENAGLHVLLTCRKKRDSSVISEKEFIDQANQAGIKVYGLSDTFIKPPKGERATFLLGYAALEKEEIKEGLEALGRMWL